ncbi:collagen alpha-1(XIV) chain-like [Saccostrea echinata]|uniref:collagen alpha-1(XIV) chain-like n=1 Tax=Saccostrea echinata TaxID=191078 RepID=UPI002A821A69|nr:collagen alpha-1(XIV) chain-like [Saccostrea echinata]
MDKSGSVKETDFDESVDFVYNVTEYLAIGSSDMQVSIVVFSSSYTEEFDLNDHTAKSDLLNAIKNLRGTRTTGRTYTYDAIDYVREYSFTSAKGGRSGANRTVVILTDGLSNNGSRTITAADNLRTEGAEVFAIGIGSTVSRSNEELRGIANDPDSYYVHYIDTFVYLCNLVPALVPKLDSTVTPSLLADCPTPPTTTPDPSITTTVQTTVTSTASTTTIADTTGTTTIADTTGTTTVADTTTERDTTSTIQTTETGTSTTVQTQHTGNSAYSSSSGSGSSSNTAAIAAGAVLGTLAAAATVVATASLLRRWHLSVKEDPVVLAAVGQYQQAPIGPSKSMFNFA